MRESVFAYMNPCLLINAWLNLVFPLSLCFDSDIYYNGFTTVPISSTAPVWLVLRQVSTVGVHVTGRNAAQRGFHPN